MATIIGTPLQITTAFFQGAVAQTTASDNGTFSPPSATNGVASHEHPTGSDFQWFDFTEDDHYEIFVEVPTAITNTTQLTSELEVTMNGVMLCMRNNVANFTATDRHFFTAFLMEEFTTTVGGQPRTNRHIYPSEIFEPVMVGGVPNSDDFIWHSGLGSTFLSFVESKSTTAQKNLTKQFITTNYQADSNGLQEPFPLATSTPHSYSTFDDSALTAKQKFKLNLRDIPGFDGKFTASGTSSKFYIYILVRPDIATYGSEQFALGIETFDIKATRSPDGFAAHLTLQSPVPLSTNVNVADTVFTRAFVGSTTYPLATAFNTTSTVQQNHNSTAAQFNITSAFNQPDTLAGFSLTSTSALSSSFTWDTFAKTNQIGIVFAGESTPSFSFNIAGVDGRLATTGIAVVLFDTTLASSSLGTTVQHTTPVTVSTAIDFEQTGLAGLIFAGESTQSTAFGQSDIANNQVFTIRAPSDKQVYTTDTDTRTVVLNQHNRTHTMGTETREIQLNTHNRSITVEQQTRSITAEALDE